MDTLQGYALVALGGAAGSVARYAMGGFVQARLGATFPWGTLAVNVAGSFVLGLVMTAAAERLGLDPRWRLLLAVGFCGGFTTLSTFAFETSKLLDDRSLLLSAANVAATVVAGVAAVRVGSALAARIW